MTFKDKAALMLLGLATLSACGVGGVSSIPPPLPSPALLPPPASDTPVELLAAPATQEFAVATHDGPFQVRYDAASSLYEVKAGTFDWSFIVDEDNVRYRGSNYSGEHDLDFALADELRTSSFSVTAHHRSSDAAFRYRYSNLADWSRYASHFDRGVHVAFGVATPASGVPVSGTATYKGLVEGQADAHNVPILDAPDFDSQTTPLAGTVILNFDFAAGSLSGEIDVNTTNCFCIRLINTGGGDRVQKHRIRSGKPDVFGCICDRSCGQQCVRRAFHRASGRRTDRPLVTALHVRRVCVPGLGGVDCQAWKLIDGVRVYVCAR